MNSILILIGKLVSFVSRTFNAGHGSTWPGHIALRINKNFIKNIIKKNPDLKIILTAGTNGKTTTSKLIRTILEHAKLRVLHNESGANLLNGIASTLVLRSNIVGKLDFDFAIFEVDENSLPLVFNELTPHILILLNLFRDQLDRYGEVNAIANKWNAAVQSLPESTTLILNADDPLIAFLGLSLAAERSNLLYFGLKEKSKTKTPQHASDSTYCPNCGTRLFYKSVLFSHLGDWHCPHCKNKRPKLDFSISRYPLPGIYNKYNALAAVLTCKNLNIDQKLIDSALQDFKPAFGRQEILNIHGKNVQLFLSKNPTSFNQSLRTISELKAKNLLIILNDRIPDGRDVSWVWDVDFEEYLNNKMNLAISGDRTYDMALRIKYSMKIGNWKLEIEEELKKAIEIALQGVSKNETLYILPTYSAMLEVRKILTGKKIL